MAKKVIAASLELDAQPAQRSVKSFRAELKEAQVDLLQMQEAFGETSAEALTAAKNVAQLKDRMADAKEVAALFDPGAKFAVFGNVVRTVAGGFSALTGAMALFGVESKDVEKTLLKVQAALAITEGLNTIADAVPQFQRLGAVAGNALKSIRTGIAATGIGLLVLALGALVAYWDDIKEAVSGVSDEQKDQLATTTALVDKEKEKLTHISSQDNILKLQGKTEKEILALKSQQVLEVINAAQAQLNAQKIIQDAQIKTAERNRAILQGIITFIAFPIKTILGVVDEIGKRFGKNFGLTDNFNKLATFVFDPAQVREEADKANAESQKGIDDLLNQRAGYILQSRAIDKSASDKAAADAKERREKEKTEHEAFLKSLNETAEKLYADGYAIRESAVGKMNALENADREKKKLAEQNDADRQSAQLETLAAIRFSAQDSITQQEQLALANTQAIYEQQMELFKGDYEAQAIITEQYENIKTALVQSALEQRLSITSDLLGKAADVLGKQTIAGKALAIAQATINTYVGASEALRAKSTLPSPFDVVAKVAAVATIIATGLKTVASIAKTQVPGAGGGAVGGGLSADAPLAPRPTVTNTQLDQGQINQMGNSTVRAYVVEADVTGKQERVSRLNRAARLG